MEVAVQVTPHDHRDNLSMASPGICPKQEHITGTGCITKQNAAVGSGGGIGQGRIGAILCRQCQGVVSAELEGWISGNKIPYQFTVYTFLLNKTYGFDTVSSFFNVCFPMLMGV